VAQLSDDCFAFEGRLIPLADAEERIADQYGCLAGAETVPLLEAMGRVLADDVIAPIAVPPVANSAVDGYAVRFDDLDPSSETALPVWGRAAAGHPLAAPLPPGHAAQVFTGAAMPEGADTVLMQEDCATAPGLVRLRPGIRRGANRRLAGEDIARDERALAAGERLGAAELALLAALGQTQIAVRRRLRVALFSTGDEIAEPGTTLPRGRVYDANRFMLAALLTRAGAVVSDGGILPDNPDQIGTALRAAAPAHDLVLTSGGVSAGEEDHVRAAIENVGTLTFWRVAIKPGRPVALGTALGTPLLGLPGNPVAALVTFLAIARPLLDRLAGAGHRPLPRFPATADFTHRKKNGRREYLRATLHGDAAAPRARLYPKEGAGIITSLTRSDVLLELSEAVTQVEPGDPVLVIPMGLIDG